LSRNNYAAAKVQGLMADLNLSDQQYQTGLSIFFVGYLLMQVPSNLILNFISRPSLYIGACVMIWGLISALTSQVQSFSGIVACRFFFGFVGVFGRIFTHCQTSIDKY
jgi:fucose permease